MKVTALGNGRYDVVTDATHTLAYAVRQHDQTWVFIGGQVFVVGASGGVGSRHSRLHDEAALAAPMPATVVSINVAPGQAVTAGDVLVTLEAMKMEMAVTAPRDGTVRAVNCRVGELVQTGVPLVALDPPPPADGGIGPAPPKPPPADGGIGPAPPKPPGEGGR
jgi:biotin carboxyl carrier protein